MVVRRTSCCRKVAQATASMVFVEHDNESLRIAPDRVLNKEKLHKLAMRLAMRSAIRVAKWMRESAMFEWMITLGSSETFARSFNDMLVRVAGQRGRIEMYTKKRVISKVSRCAKVNMRAVTRPAWASRCEPALCASCLG